ncbi:hypothetical protein PHYBOEH_011192 [Phytophthora boehmeriae]|uniref:BRO1 domain-containing protein n=1 Tax=Phytophthora boehmeriae TaxID=109152 RepID=A0A8T1WYP0_9STRA|nr:hypothetical protein PHYBOEH_011192 [Phytophthora boehmeriae]
MLPRAHARLQMQRQGLHLCVTIPARISPTPFLFCLQVPFETELKKFASSSSKSNGVARLAGELAAARAALGLDRTAATSQFQAAEDIPDYVQKLATYLSLVKGFTEIIRSQPSVGKEDAELQASVPNADDTATESLRQPLVKDNAEVESGKETDISTASVNDCSGCLHFCRWQDALSGSTVYALSARQEYAHTLLAGGILMMTDARKKIDALLSERPSELNETQLKLAYQLLLHASGVMDACLESMDITSRSIGAAFADLGATPEAASTTGNSEVVPDDDMMTKWREEQLQAQQAAPQKDASNSTTLGSSRSINTPAPGLAEDLAMLKRVADLASGHLPQLLSWIALAEAQELVVFRGVTREVVDFSLMAKLSMDIAARFKECHNFATRRLPCSNFPVAERIQLYCAFKSAYYRAITMYFQGASCMLTEDARSCAQAVANFKEAATLFEIVVPLKKNYESKLALDKEEKERVALLSSVFLRSQQVIERDLDIVTHRNDSVYYEPVPKPESPPGALSLVKATIFPVVSTSDLWRDGEQASDMGVLWNFFLTSLLLTNAVCILHEKRFLRPHGWDKVDSSQGMTIKNQVVGFLVAVQYLRFPLMAINTLMIILELIMG